MRCQCEHHRCHSAKMHREGAIPRPSPHDTYRLSRESAGRKAKQQRKVEGRRRRRRRERKKKIKGRRQETAKARRATAAAEVSKESNTHTQSKKRVRKKRRSKWGDCIAGEVKRTEKLGLRFPAQGHDSSRHDKKPLEWERACGVESETQRRSSLREREKRETACHRSPMGEGSRKAGRREGEKAKSDGWGKGVRAAKIRGAHTQRK